MLETAAAWILTAVLVVAAVGGVWAVRLERRDPSSFTRGGDLAWWGLLPAEEQEVYDTAVLDLAEQADLDAQADAEEAAQLAVQRAVDINTLTHP
ncbi:hypothetical protein [Streptomyces griseorubiginosus]|uniref:hypothetical protein n=1 Tax=Streptomyces griseorubiginosus TaxID=67304 RepID=UPI0033F4A345